MHRQAKFVQRIFLVLVIMIAAQGDAAERAKLTLGYSSTGPTGVGLWVAKDIGAFDKYGVEPNFHFFGPGDGSGADRRRRPGRRRRGECGDRGGARRRAERLGGKSRQPALSATLGSP